MILDGKQTSIELQNKMAIEVQNRKEKGLKIPHLAAVLVGKDGASQTYVNAKVKACEQIGFQSTLIHLPKETTENELLAQIETLNQDENIDGFIVQLPLPAHINVDKVFQQVKPEKDVDGFHPINVGRMVKNLPAYISATPLGILMLLEKYNIETAGKKCVVLGRSQIVGLPMSILLARNTKIGNCTVTLCHSKTSDVKKHTLDADIIVVALGIPEYLKDDMIKNGAVVIDVGITRIDDLSKKSGFKLLGDVDYQNVAPKCSAITPVPGGVGPMTITALLYNTLLACKKEIYL
ncbi:MAG: bifunctional 5,10-methylene-tetrahydrofolate dehydrogenase/5,10-methylene-tetrahydrofolate cyclohydrolase [Bacteroidetes bacterium]|nr:MAG: bifunctional 5,10-methylene-tetrahydrofolate dehydrogenase/5,10-methylene-tetrahydrofolate cyclohydrolase [Bacteroidota bacterium]TAG87672.1 MAG: bifunctional 5,10-methylene-tetrahydrofolate dehydrogenase/5,10-methylene-tetrahydrofolate cyclohydrolase [Bacteroidota bacterium]